MADIVSVLSKLPNLRSRSPVSETDIFEAEEFLGLSFSPEYRSYLKAFGAVSVNGREITGICNSDRLNVVSVTLEEWLNNQVPNDWYVIEQLNIDGILIWQDSKGSIYKTAPGCTSQKIASSLLEYIES